MPSPSVTRVNILALARLYADQRPGGVNVFIADSDAYLLMNTVLAELHEELAATGVMGYARKEQTISIVSGTSKYALPDDVFSVLAIQLEWASDDVEPVNPLDSVKDRWKYPATSWAAWGPKTYLIFGQVQAGAATSGGDHDFIEFLPAPTQAVTCRVYYIPVWSELTGDSATYRNYNALEKYVALGTAIEMRMIEESPTADLERLFARQKERIALWGDRSDIPVQVQDVYPEGLVFPFPRGRVTTL